MTTLPDAPDHLLSLAEWDALPEDTSRRLELVEGAVVVSPSPRTRHQWIAKKLGAAMDEALNPTWEALFEVDVTVAASARPTVRRPDVVVVRDEAVDDRSRLTPPDVLAVVEVLSPSSGPRDRLAKLAQYGRAGIECYLLVEPGPPVVLSEFRLRGDVYERVAQHRDLARFVLGGRLVAVDLTRLVR